MAQWHHSPSAGLATVFTLDDILRASVSFISPSPSADASTHSHLPHAQKEQPDTPVLRLVKEARNKGYETICLPLTTQNWRDRWEGMCLLPSSPAQASALESDKVEKTGENLDDFGAAHLTIDAEKKKKDRATAAEQWRARPGFLQDEVTITRIDEAEGITLMISDWLELDAEDDGIRHDAEIVLSSCLPVFLFLMYLHLTGFAARIGVCLLSPYSNRDSSCAAEQISCGVVCPCSKQLSQKHTVHLPVCPSSYIQPHHSTYTSRSTCTILRRSWPRDITRCGQCFIIVLTFTARLPSPIVAFRFCFFRRRDECHLGNVGCHKIDL